MSESAEQMKVVEWCRVTDYVSGNRLGTGLIFHIPNGGWRSKAEAAQLKAMGVRAGVSDLFLPLPSNGKSGLWIEMKAASEPGRSSGGRLSDEQGGWLAEMNARGYGAICAFGADQAIDAIKAYLGLA